MNYFLKTSLLYIPGLLLLLTQCSPEAEKPVVTKRTVDSVPPAPIAEPVEKKKEELHVSYLDSLFQSYDLVNIKTLDSGICVDLRYADTSNFLKMDLYDGLRNAYFNCITATRLCNAQYFLKQEEPGMSLVVLDAARPKHIQQLMWDSLKMPPEIKFNYLSPPSQTSMHNYGCAVDVSIIDLSDSTLLDMGSGYDFFGKISEPVYEPQFLKSGKLSQEAYKNRLLLRNVMRRAGFNPITSEWWHFSICGKEEAVAKFRLIK